MDQPSTSDASHLLSNDDLGLNTDTITVRDETTFFKPLRTIPIAVVQIILNAALFAESVLYLLVVECCRNQTPPAPVVNKSEKHCNKFIEGDCGSIIVYSIALVWMLTWMLGLAFKSLHRGHRNTGYLQFYARTNCISSIPLFAASVGCFFLLIAMTLRQGAFVLDGKTVLGESWFYFFLQIIAGAELIVVFVALVIYIVKVAKFNSRQHAPDVFDHITVSSMPLVFNARSAVEIGPGIREPNKDIALLQSVCEKQGDLIAYLRRRCDVLCERLNQAADA